MMTHKAPFPQTPKTKSVVVTAACTIADDNPANTVELLTVGENGAVLTRLTASQRATNTASTLALFLSKNGAAKQLIDTAQLVAATVSATAAVKPTKFDYSESNTLRLEKGDKLFVGSMVALAAGIVFKAEWSEY